MYVAPKVVRMYATNGISPITLLWVSVKLDFLKIGEGSFSCSVQELLYIGSIVYVCIGQKIIYIITHLARETSIIFVSHVLNYGIRIFIVIEFKVMA